MSRRGAFPVIWTGKAPWVAVLLMILALAPALTSPALAAAPQTSISDVEDEVMCPICGTLLELAESPQAERERVYVKRLIAAGKSKAEIKDALVAQYGREVLALPGGSGFDLTAYLVPAVAFLLAVAGLAVGVRRWRAAGDEPAADSAERKASGGPRGEDAERLEADLARYDL
jgi:cytochrome c-type biogenesis protein CcmH